MIIDRNTQIQLRSEYIIGAVPYSEILSQWMKSDLDPKKCRETLEQLLRVRPELEDRIRLSEFDKGGSFLDSKILFPQPQNATLYFGSRAQNISMSVPFSNMQVLAQFIRWAVTTNDESLLRSRLQKLLQIDNVDWIVAPTQSSNTEQWPVVPVQPGLTRMEHASLVITTETAKIAIDPISLQVAMPRINSLPTSDPGTDFDGILITHSHGDHWHLPSILRMTTTDTKVITPKIKQVNLLCDEDLAQILSYTGQVNSAPPWGEQVKIEDIKIEILPFFGEQPSVYKTSMNPLLRNIGNCYRIDTPSFSAMILVDSGEDPMGSQVEAVRDSVNRHGPVDVVLACLREFDCPFFGGLHTYFAALPFRELKYLWTQFQEKKLPHVTAGTEGITKICEAAQAKYFLPYAHGFEKFGKPIRDIGWTENEPSEEFIINKLQRSLADRRVATRALNWNPGDSVSFSHSKELKIQSFQDKLTHTQY